MNSILAFLRTTLAWFFLASAAWADAAQLRVVFDPNVKIPMRDGTQLAANIFRPQGDGPWPVILIRTPYGKQDEKWEGGEGFASKGLRLKILKDGSADGFCLL